MPRRFFLEYATNKWSPVKLNLLEDGTIDSIFRGEEQLNFNPPCIYPAYDRLTNQAYWIAISQNKRVYRLDYNNGELPIETLIHNQADGSLEAESFFSTKQFHKSLFSQQMYDNNCSKATFHQQEYNRKQLLLANERHRKPSDLLTSERILSDLTRDADPVQSEQLDGGDENYIYRKTREFQKQCDETYISIIKSELAEIVDAYPNNYIELKNALKEFLKKHWQEIKGAPLSYTSLLDHPVTQILLDIANKLEILEGEPAISYLMPDIYTESLYEPLIEHLTSQPLSEILKTHILDESGYYLLPINLLLETARSPEDAPSHLVRDQQIINPFYDPSTDSNPEHQYLSNKDIERLYQHSRLAGELGDAKQRLHMATHDQTTLLGRVNNLIAVLKINDAHEGIGSQEDVGEQVYSYAPKFMEYYRRLHPMQIHVSEDTLPSLAEAFTGNCEMGYVLVKSGADAGFYFLTKFDENGQISQTGYTIPLCDAQTPAKYPITVILSDTFTDTPELRASLSQNNPSLIRATSEDPEIYHLYSKQEDGNWKFTTITSAGPITLPQNTTENSDMAEVTLDPTKIPKLIYDVIEAQTEYQEQTLMLSVLSTELRESTSCELEHLSLIESQTGHLDIDAFTRIPQEVRVHINNLWHYLQNTGRNISATEGIETCVGMLREEFDNAVRKHTKVLSTIGWSDEEKANELNASVSALISAKSTLANELSSKRYQGIDVRAPSPKMLRTLGMNLEIKGPDDFKWFCNFPSEVMSAFFDVDNYSVDATDRRRPQLYLHENYNDFTKLAELLLEVPSSAFAPILSKVNYTLTANEFFLIFNYLAEDKKEALLDSLKDQLHLIIKTLSELALLHQQLNSEQQRFVIVNLQSNISIDNLQNIHQLAFLLYDASTETTREILSKVKDQLPSLINSTIVDTTLVAYFSIENSLLPLEDIDKIPLENATSPMAIGIAIRQLSDSEFTEQLDIINRLISNTTLSIEDIGFLSYCLNEERFFEVLESIKANWSLSTELRNKFTHNIIGFIEPSKREAFLSAHQAEIQEIAKTPDGVDLLIDLHLDENLSKHIFNIIDTQLLDLSNTPEKLFNLIWSLETDNKCKLILNVVFNRPNLQIDNLDTLRQVLYQNGYQLQTSRQKLLLEQIQIQIPSIIIETNDIKLINIQHRHYVLNLIKNMPIKNISSYWQFIQVAKDCDDEKFYQIICDNSHLWDEIFPCNKLYGRVTDFDARASMLKAVLSELSFNKCKVLLRNLGYGRYISNLYKICKSQGKPFKFIPNGLSYLLSADDDFSTGELPEDKKRLIISNLGRDLVSIFFEGTNLERLENYDCFSRRCILLELQDKLPELIRSADSLNKYLSMCGGDQESIKIILRAVNGKLSNWKGNNNLMQNATYANAFKLAEQNSRYSIFASAKRRHEINIGCFETKINNYINDHNNNQGSFHWLILCIGNFLTWLLGSVRVKAKETKVAAAKYALYAHKNDADCKVRLQKTNISMTNAQELKAEYANSYILSDNERHQKQLYYVDYDGNKTLIPISDPSNIQRYFDTNSSNSLTYSEVNACLEQFTKGLLPTQAQLKALQDGLLGSIMKDYPVDSILDGSFSPQANNTTNMLW